MRKRYALLVYRIYFERWSVLALLVLICAGGLWLWSPPQIRPYRDALLLGAGLGALTLVLGFALASLAFVAVGKNDLAIQLPLWRVRVPFAMMQVTRTALIEQALPGKFKDDEVAAMSALVIEMREWPQSREVLKFWLGRLVTANALVLPVDDVLSLRRAVDAGILKAREQQERSNVGTWER